MLEGAGEGIKGEDGAEGERLSLEVFLAFEWTLGNSPGSFKPYDGSHIPINVWGFLLGGEEAANLAVHLSVSAILCSE